MEIQGAQKKSKLTNLYSDVDVLVIGAGPTGLGAAKRLNQIVRGAVDTDVYKIWANRSRTAHHG